MDLKQQEADDAKQRAKKDGQLRSDMAQWVNSAQKRDDDLKAMMAASLGQRIQLMAAANKSNQRKKQNQGK